MIKKKTIRRNQTSFARNLMSKIGHLEISQAFRLLMFSVNLMPTRNRHYTMLPRYSKGTGKLQVTNRNLV